MIKLVVNIGILLLLLSQVQTETVYSYLFRSFMNQLMFTHTDTLTDMHILTVTTIQLLHLHLPQHQFQLEPQFPLPHPLLLHLQLLQLMYQQMFPTTLQFIWFLTYQTTQKKIKTRLFGESWQCSMEVKIQIQQRRH